MASEKREIRIQYTVHELNDLTAPEMVRLLEAADNALIKAYAPYSGFRVGAAVLLEDGTIITGSNQENAAYPSGLCAERVAIFASASQFPETLIKAIAVSARNKSGNPVQVTPCGSCRQVMLEYEIRQQMPIAIYLAGPDRTILHFKSMEGLLPMGFNNSQLE